MYFNTKSFPTVFCILHLYEKDNANIAKKYVITSIWWVINQKMTMKTFKFIFFLTLLFSFSSVASAQSPGIPGEVVAAISQSNAGKLTPFLGSNVELVIDKKNDVYSKQQAVKIISDFFKKNTVNSFQILHSGTKDASSFAIGTLKTSAGTYRVYILTRKADAKTVIQQLRIEPSNE